MTRSLYTIQQDGRRSLYVPTASAGSPWSSEAQHGGPPCALLAGALEAALEGQDLRPVHFRAELFRAVPMTPLRIETEVLRRGRRLLSVDARLLSDQVVARASALFLVPGREAEGEPSSGSRLRPLPGPEADLQAMIPREHVMRFPPGFHTTVEVETLPSTLQCAWVRIPCEFLPGQPLTSFQRAAATSDFCNAPRARQVSHEAGFINVDSDVQLLRDARGEWLGLELVELSDDGPTGSARCALFDQDGVFAWVSQNSLANPRTSEPSSGAG